MEIQKKVPNKMSYLDIEVDKKFEFETVLRKEDGADFAELTGDYNPLHVDEKFGAKSKFKKNIAHGMLAASLFSTLIGMYCPGEKSLYLSQTINFRKPIFYNDKIVVRGEVTNKNDSIKIITFKTQIIKDGVVTIDGEAKVQVLDDR